MRLFQVFVTVVVVLCLIKLRWPKRKNERIFFLNENWKLEFGKDVRPRCRLLRLCSLLGSLSKHDVDGSENVI